MSPRLSICVPNLNTRPFLQERFETIFNQSFQDWELLVYDSYSEDGAWEYIQELAAQEKRMRIWQGPRQGTPGSWNPCIDEARGEFVYIATSDDAMALDCMEKLVAALEQHKDCDLAHCLLVVVDETGKPRATPKWPDGSVFTTGIEELLQRPHVRRAPYNGLLALTGQVVFVSITQLLIRRSLFSRIGGFPSRWGSVSELSWEMKAGLIANSVHVPDTWATFRVHPKQSTAAVDFRSVDYARKYEEMIEDAMQACAAFIEPDVLAKLRSYWLEWSRDMRTYYAGLGHRRSVVRRRLYQLAQVFNGTAAARSEVFGQLLGRPKWDKVAPREVRLWLESLGRGPVVVPV